MRRVLLSLLACGMGVALGACTYEQSGPPQQHLADWGARAPSDNAVSVCHAYGCQKTTRVVFSRGDVAELKRVMRETKKADTPHEERRAVAYAVSWFEKEVGERIGTSADRPGMDFRASGDPTQQDCVDEATNTTSYLMFLEGHGLLKYHTVKIPLSKGRIWRGVKNWPHWTAVLEEKDSGERYAVDSWIYENGVNPAVVKVDEWYIKDLDNLSKPTT